MNRKHRDERFRRWIADYRGILVRISGAFASASDRDDLIQEMMLALWHALPRFRGESAESTFIYRVAQNTALAWCRRRARAWRGEPLDEEPSDLPGRGPESELARADRERRLCAALGRLGAIDRSLALMQLEGLSYREMAEVTGLTESNVGVRLNRARGKLKSLLGDDT